MSSNPLEVLDTLPISSWKYPRFLVGVPLERTQHHKVFFPFARLFAQGPTFIQGAYTSRIDVARNQMAKELLLTTYTHVVMLDNDHDHPDTILHQFARWILIYGDKVPVLSGLNFRRQAPFDPVAGTRDENGRRPVMAEWEPGLMQVEEVGGASLCISRTVFETMEPPWFANIYDDVWNNNWPGEDIYFARKCKEYGIPVFVDTTTSSPHLTSSMVTEETFRKYLEEHPTEFTDV